MSPMSKEEKDAFDLGRTEFFMVCRGDPEAERQWPKAAAAIGAAVLPFKAKIEALTGELAETKAWLKLLGRQEEQQMTAERA